MTGTRGKGGTPWPSMAGKTSPAGRSGEDSKPVGRQAVVRVRTASRRSKSSAEWLSRQLNDPYVAESQRQGYRSRAAFKLIQLDERFRLLRPGMRIVDLGCAPGGWSQIAARRIGSKESQIRVVGIDLLETPPLPGVTLLQGDFLAADSPEAIKAALGGTADLVLSDMAAAATGHAATDHLRIVALAEAAYDLAAEILQPGGAFVAKVFQGGAEGALLARLKQAFASVRHAKPPASRAESAETYVVAQGFRPASKPAAGPKPTTDAARD